jgi:tol-pal system protein YbgF
MGKLFVLILGSFVASGLWAAPVVNLTNSDDSSQQALVQSDDSSTAQAVDTSSMSVEKRLARLEQLVNSQGQMQLMQRFQQLQQHMDILQGQNEVLQHELKQMQTRQHYLYQQLSKGDKVKMPKTSMPTDTNAAPDQVTYQKAYGLITQSDYDGAIDSLQAFVKKYPLSAQVPNALYWLGEVLSAQGKNAEAEAALQQLVKQFPKNTRVSDAQLKLATLAINRDQLPEAKQLLQAIIKQYPGTPTASIAANKLRTLQG